MRRIRTFRLDSDENEKLVKEFNKYLYKKQEYERKLDKFRANAPKSKYSSKTQKETQTLRKSSYYGSMAKNQSLPCCWAGSSDILEREPPPPKNDFSYAYECFCNLEKKTEENLCHSVSFGRSWDEYRKESREKTDFEENEEDDYKCECDKTDPVVMVCFPEYSKRRTLGDDDQQALLLSTTSQAEMRKKSGRYRDECDDFGHGGKEEQRVVFPKDSKRYECDDGEYGGYNKVTNKGYTGKGLTEEELLNGKRFSQGYEDPSKMCYCKNGGFGGMSGGMSCGIGGGGGFGGFGGCCCGMSGKNGPAGAWPEKNYGPPRGAGQEGCFCKEGGGLSGVDGGPCFCDATFIPYVEKRCQCKKLPDPEPYYPMEGRTVYTMSYMQNVELVREKKNQAVCPPICCCPVMCCYSNGKTYGGGFNGGFNGGMQAFNGLQGVNGLKGFNGKGGGCC